MPKILLANKITPLFPNLKTDLRMARSKDTPLQFIGKALKTSFIYGFLFTILFFFVLEKSDKPFVLLIPIYMIIIQS